MTESPKLYRRLVDALLQRFENGEFKAGDRLPTERELADAYEISRTTVREAVVALEMLGIVEMRRGSGIYFLGPTVVATTADDLDVGAFELMEARRAYESETAAIAAQRMTPEIIADLERLMEQMEGANGLEREKADEQFHLAIAHATGNGAMIAVVAALWDMRRRSPLARTMLGRALGPDAHARAHEHAEVVQALRAGDSQAARAAMRHHLDAVIEHILLMTESDEIEAARTRSRKLRERILGATAVALLQTP